MTRVQFPVAEIFEQISLPPRGIFRVQTPRIAARFAQGRCNGPVAQWIRHRSTEPEIVGSSPTRVRYPDFLWSFFDSVGGRESLLMRGISGLVVEYIVAIDVTRVRFPADARFLDAEGVSKTLRKILVVWRLSDVV